MKRGGNAMMPGLGDKDVGVRGMIVKRMGKRMQAHRAIICMGKEEGLLCKKHE